MNISLSVILHLNIFYSNRKTKMSEDRFRRIEDKLILQDNKINLLTLVKDYMNQDLHEVKDSVAALTLQLNSINTVLISSQAYIKGAVWVMGIFGSICTLILGYLALK